MGFCCKFASHQRAWCAWFSDACEIVTCSNFCKCYRQACCFEIICGCPLQDAYVNTDIAFGQIPPPASSGAAATTRPCT
ncbi:hypothetical protein EON64_10050 [archaeon]|nr:MAG: hypothetical protein EON64_10050 [archaeon]